MENNYFVSIEANGAVVVEQFTESDIHKLYKHSLIDLLHVNVMPNVANHYYRLRRK